MRSRQKRAELEKVPFGPTGLAENHVGFDAAGGGEASDRDMAAEQNSLD
jgi:hypothetical protein